MLEATLLGSLLLAIPTIALGLLLGRVLGISGILANPFTETWKFLFSVSLALGGIAAHYFHLDNPLPAFVTVAPPSTLALIASGFCVGLGTRLGSGCTSGHGLCGLARLSPRSFTAVLIFMASAMAITFFSGRIAHSQFPYSPQLSLNLDPRLYFTQITVVLVAFGLFSCLLLLRPSPIAVNSTTILSGFFFGTGLVMTGMTEPTKVLSFLSLPALLFKSEFENPVWDPSLLFVMMGGMLPNLLAYNFFIRKTSKPLLNSKFHFPTRRDIDLNLIIGAALFGVGWGYSGFCPGPGFIAMVTKPDASVLPWITGAAGGVLLHRMTVKLPKSHSKAN